MRKSDSNKIPEGTIIAINQGAAKQSRSSKARSSDIFDLLDDADDLTDIDTIASRHALKVSFLGLPSEELSIKIMQAIQNTVVQHDAKLKALDLSVKKLELALTEEKMARIQADSQLARVGSALLAEKEKMRKEVKKLRKDVRLLSVKGEDTKVEEILSECRERGAGTKLLSKNKKKGKHESLYAAGKKIFAAQ